ncbi:hypothetical protein BVRB_9g205400 [Beta vulgaris subsp. vulgaris]|nr:hypothetical protein BVRB_9g205400 [Beta vulgaris subsp. vulgaris]
MPTQEFLKTLKTAKRAFPSTISSSLNYELTPINTLINSAFDTVSSPHHTISSFLSSLSSHQLISFLSDPNVKTYDCLRIFNIVLHNQSDLSFKPDFHAHFTVICRLIKSRLFSDAEFLLKKLLLGPNYRYPFSDFTSWVENYCKESKIITKLLNMLLKMYSDHHMFDMVITVFEYMVEKEVERDERTCSVHLYALIKTDKVDLAFEFFRRMVDSGMEVSVFSLTIVVSGLCDIGELKIARELVEEMIKKGVRPNVVTVNTLIDACSRRWEFEELDVVLCLMEREGIEFNDTTYKLLIEGYSGFGKVDEARKLLLEMQDKDIEAEVHLYDMVIKGYCRLGDISSGYALLRKMQEEDIGPCGDIYTCLIGAMCKFRVMDQVKELVDELLNNEGGELNDVVLNALVDGYQKVGMVDELEEVKRMVKVKCHPDHKSCQDSIDAVLKDW